APGPLVDGMSLAMVPAAPSLAPPVVCTVGRTGCPCGPSGTCARPQDICSGRGVAGVCIRRGCVDGEPGCRCGECGHCNGENEAAGPSPPPPPGIITLPPAVAVCNGTAGGCVWANRGLTTLTSPC